jgi:hypothetical protein
MELLKEVRKYRVFKMSIFDWVCTFLAAYILTLYINNSQMDWSLFLSMMILLLTIGIVLHIIFKKKTMLNYYLGTGDRPEGR